MKKPRKCKSCPIEYIPRTFAQPRCQKCNFQRLKEKAKTYKPLKAEKKKFKINQDELIELETTADELFSFAIDICEGMLKGRAETSQNNINLIKNLLHNKYDRKDNMMHDQFILSRNIKKNLKQETNAKFKQSRYKPIFDVCYKFIPLYKRLLNNITLGIFNKYIFSDI